MGYMFSLFRLQQKSENTETVFTKRSYSKIPVLKQHLYGKNYEADSNGSCINIDSEKCSVVGETKASFRIITFLHNT